MITISYEINITDSARFMVSSLSNFVDNLADGTHKIKCTDCDCFLEYESVKDNLNINVFLAIKVTQTRWTVN